MLRGDLTMSRLGFLAGFTLALAVSANAGEACHTITESRYAQSVHVCVSSHLQPQGANSYGPSHLVDGYRETAWCEGVAGVGIGEAVTVHIDGARPFRRVFLVNGYGKSADTFGRNARLRQIEISTDSGAYSRVELADHNELVFIDLPQEAAHRSIRMRVLSVYPGSRYDDLCLSAFGPVLSDQPTAPAPPVAPAPSGPPAAGGDGPADETFGSDMDDVPVLPPLQ